MSDQNNIVTPIEQKIPILDETKCGVCNLQFKNKHFYYLHIHKDEHKKAVIDKLDDDKKKILNDQTSHQVKGYLKKYLIESKKLLDDLIRQMN
jgi:hypothetical protein